MVFLKAARGGVTGVGPSAFDHSDMPLQSSGIKRSVVQGNESITSTHAIAAQPRPWSFVLTRPGMTR
jgi:hypothetical protein